MSEQGSDERLYVLRYRLVLFLEKTSPEWEWVPLAKLAEAFGGVPASTLEATLARMKEDGVVDLDPGLACVRLLKKF